MEEADVLGEGQQRNGYIFFYLHKDLWSQARHGHVQARHDEGARQRQGPGVRAEEGLGWPGAVLHLLHPAADVKQNMGLRRPGGGEQGVGDAGRGRRSRCACTGP